jgi:hypothetical protein
MLTVIWFNEVGSQQGTIGGLVEQLAIEEQLVSILAVRTAPSMQQGQLVMWNSH